MLQCYIEKPQAGDGVDIDGRDLPGLDGGRGIILRAGENDIADLDVFDVAGDGMTLGVIAHHGPPSLQR